MTILFYIYSIITAPQIGCSDKELYLEIGNFLNKKNCVTLQSGKDECLIFKNKNTYVYPNTINLSAPEYLMSVQKEFDFNKIWLIKTQMDSLSGELIPDYFFNSFKYRAVDDIINAEVIISVSPFFLHEDKKYCILNIRDYTRTIRWLIKLSFFDNKIDSFALDLMSV